MSSDTRPAIVWFRQDLRLADQPALAAAVSEGPVIPVYVLDDDAPGHWKIGGAQRWWLHHSLTSLDSDLQDAGSRLILRKGDAVETLKALLQETNASAIYATRHDEPWWRAAEDALGERLVLHDGNHLAPVDHVTTGSGGHYKVYSSFWKALSAHMPPPRPQPAPDTIPAPPSWPASDRLSDWKLLPTKPDWAAAFGDAWSPGEQGAQDAIERFAGKASGYDDTRNLPAEEGTARLSPHLHFGEISARAVWHAVDGRSHGAAVFRQELAWRDFTSGVIIDRPDYADSNGRAQYDKLPWRDISDAGVRADFNAWTKGRTGYPIVDAGMRQLWTTGWMHNRVRMIAASFLIKHLLIDWREGERWFWDTLVDADYANNSVNWQWTAGTGVDSNMFARIMAPLSQSERFDAGDYIREWVPELKDVADDAIHDPEEAGCKPMNYPSKLIGHREARARALEANKRV